MRTDLDALLAENIKAVTGELETAKDVVLALSNELADVIDVIEPALAEHTKRLRQARMTSLDEIRHITTGIKELRTVLHSPETAAMMATAERFLVLCRELEEFRAVGFLDSFVRLFCEHTEMGRR